MMKRNEYRNYRNMYHHHQRKEKEKENQKKRNIKSRKMLVSKHTMASIKKREVGNMFIDDLGIFVVLEIGSKLMYKVVGGYR